MTRSIVLGAGEIGTVLARRLIERGDEVRLLSRSGTVLEGAAAIALDATDPAALIAVLEDADTLYVCTNPSEYWSWAELWPPLIDSAIVAARATGVDVVLMGNLYAYGRPETPMTEHHPEAPVEEKGRIRQQIWHRLREAAAAGGFRAVEVRASDYFGAGVGANAHLGRDFFTALLEGRSARAVGHPGREHSWSYLPDIATTLMAAAAHPGPWGRVWHVPSGSRSRRRIAAEVQQRSGATGRVQGTPILLLRLLGLRDPMMRELARSGYQFSRDFVIDSAETERELGVSATPWEQALEETLDSYR